MAGEGSGHSAVAPFAPRLDDDPIRFVPRGTEALDLLLVYARAIAGGQRLHTPELRRLAVTHIHELIAATVSATRDSLAIAGGRGIRAARLRAIMADTSANLGDCDLTAAAVAQRRDMFTGFSRAKGSPSLPMFWSGGFLVRTAF